MLITFISIQRGNLAAAAKTSSALQRKYTALSNSTAVPLSSHTFQDFKI